MAARSACACPAVEIWKWLFDRALTRERDAPLRGLAAHGVSLSFLGLAYPVTCQSRELRQRCSQWLSFKNRPIRRVVVRRFQGKVSPVFIAPLRLKLTLWLTAPDQTQSSAPSRRLGCLIRSITNLGSNHLTFWGGNANNNANHNGIDFVVIDNAHVNTPCQPQCQ
jgi:hypothetical protein